MVPVYTQRVNTSFGPVTDIVSNADATYNAMVLEARRRLRGGLEFRVSWTWSKAIDYGQGGAMPRTNAQFDPFDVRYDKGLSALNYPHRVVASAVWEPRLGGDRRWVRVAANGWTVAPLFTESSGRPYSYDIFGGTRLSGGHESINGAGGAVYLPTVGRNTLRLPDTARCGSAGEPGGAGDGEGTGARKCGGVQSDEPGELLGDDAAGVSGGDGDEWGDSAGLSERCDGGGGGVECAAVRDVYGGIDRAVAGAAGAGGSQGGVLRSQCCEMERVLPSGSVNHATLAPSGAVQTPSELCSK